jgi:hypothetical protein
VPKRANGPIVKNKGGRPTKYTEALALAICGHIADGLSLRSIEAIAGMPTKTTVLAWAIEDRSGFLAKYSRARELQLEGESDEIIDISDDGRNDWVEREARSGTYIALNKEAVDRSKLRVAARQWRLERLAPKKYSSRVALEHTADNAFISLLKLMSKDYPL